ncbi:MAG: agmatinase [Syntrophales bacterium]|jgi:agmatinase|nr:agmatinase [Syntrophales bacterium]MCK9528288.1 agmatinase [Syntrophales bacterium]MDX9922420.1 agmatinase [Syntrophales bacterium]
MNFAGLEAENIDHEGALFEVLPVPYDLTSTYQAGSRRGPIAILEASAQVELYDDELRRETWKAGIITRPFLEIDARGPEYMVRKVREEVAATLSRDKIPVVLGGEHSITLGAVQAVKERYSNLSVLQLDAHADLRDTYQETPFSHACVGRRILEICPLVQAGIRNLAGEEADFIAVNHGILSLSAEETLQPGWIERIRDGLTDDVYITIDLDAFDPSIMPSTGTPEPGGLSWADVLSLVRTVSASKRIRGFDVVELCPIPGLPAPDFMAAKLVYRVMGYIVTSRLSGKGEVH